jgi:glycosyltransferase involved in cell wall biosynthesis
VGRKRFSERCFSDAGHPPQNYFICVHLSIITVNWRAEDFLRLLQESIERFTTCSFEVVVIDNSQENRGHGEGLVEGSKLAKGRFSMFVDVDCHFLHHGWNDLLLPLAEEYDVVGGQGVPEKPIRPACMVMKTEIAQSYDWRATPEYKGHRVTPEGFDVAVGAYHHLLDEGKRILLLDHRRNRYGTLNGEEFLVKETPFLYHHWHGSHLQERGVDFPNVDLFADKDLLFRSIPWRIL